MNGNGYDVDKWERTKKLAEQNDIQWNTVGQNIELNRGKRHFGIFDTIDGAYSFLVGYTFSQSFKET